MTTLIIDEKSKMKCVNSIVKHVRTNNIDLITYEFYCIKVDYYSYLSIFFPGILSNLIIQYTGDGQVFDIECWVYAECWNSWIYNISVSNEKLNVKFHFKTSPYKDINYIMSDNIGNLTILNFEFIIQIIETNKLEPLLTLNGDDLQKECLKVINSIQDSQYNDTIALQCKNIIMNIKKKQCMDELLLLYILYNDIRRGLLKKLKLSSN